MTTRVYAGNGTLLGEYARERRIFVPIAFVPKLVINAFTSAEDKNFFSHPGIDPSGILRAAVKDVVQRPRAQAARGRLDHHPAGGEEFPPQQRSEVLAARSARRSWRSASTRPIRRRKFSSSISTRFSSARIPMESRRPRSTISASRSISSTFPKPRSWPHCRKRPAITIRATNKQAALDRRNWVIGQMADNGYITADQAQRGDRRTARHPDASAGHPGRRRRLFRRGNAAHALFEIRPKRAV